MPNFYAFYPPGATAGSNASVGINGATAPTSSTEVGGINPGGSLNPLHLDNSNNLLVSVTSSVIPTGGATAANQVLEIADLDAINTKTPALGQALAAASVPVVLTAAQLTTLTPLSTVTVVQPTGTNLHTTVDNFPATQPVSGTVAVTQSTSPWVNNTSQINGVTPLMGNGVTGTGSQRVTIASDNTAFAVNATLQASSAVVGHVINDAGSAIIGKVGIDQTTPGTTNAVSIAQVGATGIAAGQSAAASSIPVTLSNENVQDLFFTGQAAQTATINNIIPASAGATATDLTGYRSASVQILCPAGTYTTGAIIFEGSNDNTNFVTIPVWNQLLLTGAPLTAAITLVTTTFIVYVFPVTTRYVRVRISTAVSGASASVQAISKFSQMSFAPGIQQVAQATAANFNATVTATNLSTNLAQVAAATTLVGAGPTGTGSLRTTVANIAAATLANVASSATNVTLLASAAGRIGAAFFNDSTSLVYLKLGATASATSYTVQIVPGGYYELPQPCYSGIIDGIWASANGNARVTSW